MRSLWHLSFLIPSRAESQKNFESGTKVLFVLMRVKHTDGSGVQRSGILVLLAALHIYKSGGFFSVSLSQRVFFCELFQISCLYSAFSIK